MGVIGLQPRAKAICLGLAVLFEILVSVLPNGSVIDIFASLHRLPAHIKRLLLPPSLPQFFLLLFFPGFSQ